MLPTDLPILRQHFLRINNRSGRHIWEKGNEQDIFPQAARPNLSFISICQKSNLLKGKKTDTKGQCKLQNRILQPFHLTPASRYCIKIFKKAK